MKFLQSLSLFLSAALAVSAQRVSIGAPADGTSVSAGQTVTVEIDRPNFQSSATEVAVVIGTSPCGPTGSDCISPSESMGTILYNGPYDPQFVTGAGNRPPQQNFSVTIPQYSGSGLLQLNVMHVSLLGATEGPFLETLNVTLKYTN